MLERPLLAEAIGKRIISSGLLSSEEFERLWKEASRDITAPSSDVSSLLRPTNRDTLATGSWEIKEVARDTERDFQILLVWVKDRQLRPMLVHQHKGSEFVVVLSGGIMMSIDGESCIIKAPGCKLIPQGSFHSATPLDRSTVLLTVLSPLEPAFTVEKAA